ncbi:hypothetical protein [Nocardia sp. NPDC004722]
MSDRLPGSAVQRLINEVLARYGSIEAFCDYLHGLLDAPTEQLPIAAPALVSGSSGRHRLHEW